MATLGDNELKALNTLVDDIVGLEGDRKGARSDRSEEIKAMRAQKLPADALVKIVKDRRLDPEKLAEAREHMRMAGALLGVAVYVAESAPLAEAPGGEMTNAAKLGVERVEALDGEIATLGEEIKGKYAQIKAMGVDVGVIRRIVRNRLDPEAEERRGENDALYETYVANLERIRTRATEERVAEEEIY